MNAKLVNEPIRNTSIPYLASDVWFQDNEEKELKEPSRWDHKMYQDYGTHVIDELNELASEASQQCLNLRHQQLPAPVPAPHPGLFPPMVPGPSSSLSLSLPPPTYASLVPPFPGPRVLPPLGVPPVSVSPPGLPPLGVPPPVVLPPGVLPAGFPPTQPTVSYPAVSSFSISGSTKNHPGLKSNPTINAASTLEKEFFGEKETILIDDDTEPSVRGEPTKSSRQEPVSNSQRSSVNDELERETARLARQISKNRAPVSRGVPEYDKYGYFIRRPASGGDGDGADDDPTEVFRRMFPGRNGRHEGRRKRTRTRTRSRSSDKRRRERSHSRGRRTKSPSRGRRTRSKSRPRGRTSRSRSGSRGRRTRSKSRPRSRTTRSRSRDRRRRSRRHSSRSERRRSKSKSRQKKTRSRSPSKGKSTGVQKYAGPPVPSFMMHPADRLFSGEAGRSKSVRKRMQMRAESGYDNVDKQKAGLEQTLQLIKNMAADDGEALKAPVVVTIEVEILDDGKHRQFTQLGVGCEDKETGIYNRSLFKAILPTEMEAYEKNLILKNQVNLHSSLKFKFDETNMSYTFLHVKKGEVNLVSEETALKDLISFLGELKEDEGVVLLTLNRSTFIPLLIERLEKYGLLAEFDKNVRGICDFASCVDNLKLNGFWKECKFGDLVDVFKHIMGKSWPKEQRHCDGISILSGSILKKLVLDYTNYLNDMDLNLSYTKFLQVCGLKSVFESRDTMKNEINSIKTKEAESIDIKELELKPSDRPGEITIITLKRFECIDVLDVDEVEEEGIKEEDYFEEESHSSLVLSEVTVKPGFVVPITVKLLSNSEDTVNKKDQWCLIHKNLHFGAAIVKSEDKKVAEQQKARIAVARQCQISRQIVQISTSLKPVRDSMSHCEEVNIVQLKVLNPLDTDLVLQPGDDIALVRLEKSVSPNDPQAKTYSQIKEEALRSVSSGQSQETEEGEIKSGGQSLSHDTEEGEFVVEDSRKRRRKKKRRPSEDLETISEDSEEDSLALTSSDEESLSPDRVMETEEISEGEEDFGSSDRQPSVDDLSDVSDSGELLIQDIETVERKPVNPDFFNKIFYVQTFEGYTSIKAKETKGIAMKVKPAYGYTEEDMAGRNCKISINPEYVSAGNMNGVFKKLNNYSLQELATRLELKQEPRGDKRSLIIEVKITNNINTAQHYPKGVALGICIFIEDKPTQPAERAKPSSKPASVRKLLEMHKKIIEKTPIVATTTKTTPEVATATKTTPVAATATKTTPVVATATKTTPVATATNTTPVATATNTTPVVESSVSDRSVLVKCYPAKSFRLHGMSSTYHTFIIDSRLPMEDLLGQECVVSQNVNFVGLMRDEDKRVMRCCSVVESRTCIKKYTSPSSGRSYPSVNILVKNINPRLVDIARDIPLALCRIHSQEVSCSSGSAVDVGLPTPVPIIKISESSQKIYTDSSSSSLSSQVPSVAELRSQSVKMLKSYLCEAGLHQQGLKSELIKRLQEFYSKNPSKIPKKIPNSKDIVEVIGDEVQQSARQVEDGHGRSVTITSANGSYQANGRSLRVLGNRKDDPDINGIGAPVQDYSSISVKITNPIAQKVFSDKQKIIEVDKEKVLKKIGEIKSFEKQNLEFFKNGNSIVCRDDLRLGPSERKIVTFSLGDLGLFSSELAGRRLLIKERDCDRRILNVDKQICSINILPGGKSAQVDVLVQNIYNTELIVKAEEKKKIIRVYVERREKDLDHQFHIPEDDEIPDEVNDLVDEQILNATTCDDIVLLPKTYLTETCSVKLSHNLEVPSVGLLERTKTSNMQIGMRKMIIIPKVLCYVSPGETASTATVTVRVYNASKQSLKITKKTIIAQVRLQKDRTVLSEREYPVKADQRRKYGELEDPDIVGNLREGQPVLLDCSVTSGVKKPQIVRLVRRREKILVPLFSESAGKWKYFNTE